MFLLLVYNSVCIFVCDREIRVWQLWDSECESRKVWIIQDYSQLCIQLWHTHTHTQTWTLTYRQNRNAYNHVQSFVALCMWLPVTCMWSLNEKKKSTFQSLSAELHFMGISECVLHVEWWHNEPGSSCERNLPFIRSDTESQRERATSE